MDNPYILMLIALVILAVIDLVVGVSNDAINFLNSAIGSKVLSVRNIMIIASLGIFLGAATSSGMMEVARKGIFMPAEFQFNEIMYIFLAVMITDILLLDTFNSLGMPTSTTVSIVFELLGAAVAMALIKISLDHTETISEISKYINSGKALEIILGILLSVVIAFSVGALVQFVSRLVYSFQFEKKKKYINAIFGGIAITAITYFILLKGIKGSPYAKHIVETIYNGGAEGMLDWANNFFGSSYETIKELAKEKKGLIRLDQATGTIGLTIRGFLEVNILPIIGASFVLWSLIGYLLVSISKFNILKFIIGIGTFSLALAFAGNDLVNFIGVPMAAMSSYDAWHEAWASTGVLASDFSMGVLNKKVPMHIGNVPQIVLLFIAGGIMVLTLWFSNKAKKVAATEINLSRQSDAPERFQPNQLSRVVVRGTSAISRTIERIIPDVLLKRIEKQFKKPQLNLSQEETHDLPAFDMIRASVNLVVAGVLISIATSYKLPLSTTYVTFMVAMGTSLADKAWGRESAVYRVAGVLNVIGGWFLTAFSAFTIAAIFTFIIYYGEGTAVALLFTLVLFLLGKSTLKHAKETKKDKARQKIEKAELKTINMVIKESSNHISEVIRRVNKLYGHVLTDLSAHNLNKLSKTEKHVKKLNSEVNELRNNVFYFIKSLNESSVKASKFYILVLGYLQDVTQSIEFISSSSFTHVNNNHKNLKKSQIADLTAIKEQLSSLLEQIEEDFNNDNLGNIQEIIDSKQKLFDYVSESLDKQVNRIRTEESSKRNTVLYFGILLETKDLVKALMSLLELYQEHHLMYKEMKKNQ